ncbi:flagellar hook-length control protein FliK [Gracilibacillus sp. HCP3S3_G5_1]|uniref:flagellar hook-length control protein FliK n=1 Tax=unclassified Gracilibacillus TaxID=2625209 RepID=UPI003F8C7CA8
MIIATEWLANSSAIQPANTIRSKTANANFSDLLLSGLTNSNQRSSLTGYDEETTSDSSFQELIANLSKDDLLALTNILETINGQLETEEFDITAEELITENLTEDQLETIAEQLGLESPEALSDIITQLLEQIQRLRDNQQLEASMSYHSVYPSDGYLVRNNVVQQQNGNGVLTDNILPLIGQTEKLLQQIQNQTMHKLDYKEILQLLKQWSQMNNQTLNVAQTLLSEESNGNKSELWSKLLSNFNSRQSMEQHYGNVQKVTQHDVKRWIENAMERLELASKQEQTQSLRSDALQQIQSKVQQYSIHLSLTNNEEQVVHKQLMNQLQQVMKNSNFMKLSNGSNQLMIRLHPEHLGEVTVKLTQINGEMTVKMITSTQAAKELLEGNMNQLRHMFSPQQVLVEKQENYSQTSQDKLTDDSTNSQENDNQQQHSDHEEQESHHESQEHQSFHDVLMDAKV